MKIIYKSQYDATEFDMDRYLASLNKYGKVTKKQVEEALEEYAGYDVLHYSVLVEIGVKLLPDEASAKAYYKDHEIDNNAFERLRRITGYLVGSLERWNSAKQSEEKARVKHNIDGYKYDKASGQYTPEEKTAIEILKLENSVMSQI